MDFFVGFLNVIGIFFRLKTIFTFDENQEIIVSFIVYNLIIIFSKNPIIRRIIIPYIIIKPYIISFDYFFYQSFTITV